MITGNKYLDGIIIILVGLLAFKVFKAIGGVFDKLDPDKAASEERDTAIEAQSDSATRNALLFFNPSHGFKEVLKKYKTLNAYYLNKANFTNNEAEKISKEIADAHSWVSDNEQGVYSALIRVPSLACLSLVSGRFNQLYPKEKGLLNYLSSFLSGEEIAVVYGILKRKPTL